MLGALDDAGIASSRVTDAAGILAHEITVFRDILNRLMKNSIRAADDPEEPSAASPRLAVFSEYGSAASPCICLLGIALATKRVLHQPVKASAIRFDTPPSDPAALALRAAKTLSRIDDALNTN
jgi:hypothetical protein